ncbi:TPA: peptidase [Vibrio vulnificus]|nr:peptidase [Vibrio vulnificus]
MLSKTILGFVFLFLSFFSSANCEIYSIDSLLDKLELPDYIQTHSELKEHLLPKLGGTVYQPYISRYLDELNPNLAQNTELTLDNLIWVNSLIESKYVDKFKKAIAHVKVNKLSSVSEFDSKYLIGKELSKADSIFLSKSLSSNITIVATHDNVTTYWKHLDGVQVRGHPDGVTWNTIPGAGAPDGELELVIALKQGSDGVWHIPSGNHGSNNLVLHEYGHALDKIVGRKLDGKAFSQSEDFYRSWYNEYASGNLKDNYYIQPANNYSAALEETFAEGFAKLFDYGSVSEYEWPNVATYFYSVLKKKLQDDFDLFG